MRHGFSDLSSRTSRSRRAHVIHFCKSLAFALSVLGTGQPAWSATAPPISASDASIVAITQQGPPPPSGAKSVIEPRRKTWSARRWQIQGGANVDTKGIRDRGKGAMRFSVRPGDGRPQDLSNGTERAELRDLANAPIGVEVRYGFSAKIAPGRRIAGVNGTFNEPWLIFAQLHTSDDMVGNFSPVWALSLTPGDIFKVKIHGSEQEVHPTKGGMYETVLYQNPAFQRGLWYRFDISQLYCPGGVSRLSVVMNGRSIVDYSGVLGFIGDRTPYFKTGIYRSRMNSTDVVDIKRLSVQRAASGPAYAGTCSEGSK